MKKNLTNDDTGTKRNKTDTNLPKYTPNIITKYKLKIGYKGSIMEKTIANTIL